MPDDDQPENHREYIRLMGEYKDNLKEYKEQQKSIGLIQGTYDDGLRRRISELVMPQVGQPAPVPPAPPVLSGDYYEVLLRFLHGTNNINLQNLRAEWAALKFNPKGSFSVFANKCQRIFERMHAIGDKQCTREWQVLEFQTKIEECRDQNWDNAITKVLANLPNVAARTTATIISELKKYEERYKRWDAEDEQLNHVDKRTRKGKKDKKKNGKDKPYERKTFDKCPHCKKENVKHKASECTSNPRNRDQTKGEHANTIKVNGQVYVLKETSTSPKTKKKVAINESVDHVELVDEVGEEHLNAIEIDKINAELQDAEALLKEHAMREEDRLTAIELEEVNRILEKNKISKDADGDVEMVDAQVASKPKIKISMSNYMSRKSTGGKTVPKADGTVDRYDEFGLLTYDGDENESEVSDKGESSD